MTRRIIIFTLLFAAPVFADELETIESVLMTEVFKGRDAYETTKLTKCAALAAATSSVLAETGENWDRDYDPQEMFRSAAYVLNSKGLYNSATFSSGLFRFQDQYVDHMFLSYEGSGTVFSSIIRSDFEFCEVALTE